MSRFLLPLLLLSCCLFACPAGLLAASCESARELTGSGTTITTAEPVSGGVLTTPYGDTISNLPPICRVVGILRPTPDSEIRFEVWLPSAGWNERFLGVGNGGFAGTINYGQMASNVRLGSATAGTDTGHQAGAEDASWAFHHPEKIIDYGYRALHLTTLSAKQVIAAVYGRPAQHAYFDSCSTGGREGLIEAQRYPEDYDGILDGAPANNWTHLLSSGVDIARALTGDPAGYVSTMKLPAIHRAVLEACDALDGVKDGIVSDPARCHFDPASLLCKGEDALTCLTAPQVHTLAKLYSGGATPDGTSIFPGYAPGSEFPAWTTWVLGGGPGSGSGARYAANYFRYMVTNDPKWEALNTDSATALKQATAATGQQMDATDPNLRPFTARGGKLILYHGWNDPAISPWNTINYWKSVRDTLGAEATQAAVALYMAPGMEHCSGGPGASSFGQLGLQPGAGAGSGGLDALEAWVEKGTVPGAIVAAKFNGTGKAATITMTRPLCRYPEVAKYDGMGNANVAESFSCKAP